MDDPEERDPGRGGGGDGLRRLLAESLAGFARTLSGAEEIAPVLYDLADRVATALGAAGAGVILLDGDRALAGPASRPLAVSFERIEEELQEGPGLESALSGRPVLVADLLTCGDRWPRYLSRASGTGIRAVASVPLRAGEVAIGALSIYHGSPREWPAAEIQPVRVLADLAAGYVDLARRLDRQRRLAEQLQRALDSRVVTEQAKGIIAAHRGVGMDRAFEILRRHANRHGATVEQTADAVVRLGLRP